MTEIEKVLARAIERYFNVPVTVGKTISASGVATDITLAVILALREAGFAVVPREPTDAMTSAGNQVWNDQWSFHCRRAWRAMIAAAEANDG